MEETSKKDGDKESSRSSTRHPVAIPVEFRGPKGFLQAVTVNVSHGGMFLHSKKILPKGSKVFFRLQPPSGIHVNLEGEVVWVKRQKRASSVLPKGMGIRFVPNETNPRETIPDLLSILNIAA